MRIRVHHLFRLCGRLDGGIEGDAGKVDAVGVIRIDLGNRFEFVGPERDVPSGAARRLSQRRAPGATPKDSHALKRLHLAVLQVSVHDFGAAFRCLRKPFAQLRVRSNA